MRTQLAVNEMKESHCECFRKESGKSSSILVTFRSIFNSSLDSCFTF